MYRLTYESDYVPELNVWRHVLPHRHYHRRHEGAWRAAALAFARDDDHLTGSLAEDLTAVSEAGLLPILRAPS
jgi:hypothetical protein